MYTRPLQWGNRGLWQSLISGLVSVHLHYWYTVVWENFAIKINISGVTPWKLNTQFFNWINREGVLFLDTDDADVFCAMDDMVVV